MKENDSGFGGEGLWLKMKRKKGYESELFV